MLIALAGVVAGFIHVISGPDHLTAVAPLSLVRGRHDWKTGFRWGMGHAGGVLFVGLLFLLLREVLPLEKISSWSERVVGLTLIGIGFWGLRRAAQHHVHTHAHTHDGSTHVHMHVHGTEGSPHTDQNPKHLHTHAAFAVGTLHGLAGSSHFIGVLPALAFVSRWDAMTYLASFGFGTVAAMVGFTSALSYLAWRTAWTGPQAYRGLMTFCSITAMAVGFYWLVG